MDNLDPNGFTDIDDFLKGIVGRWVNFNFVGDEKHATRSAVVVKVDSERGLILVSNTNQTMLVNLANVQMISPSGDGWEWHTHD